MGDSTFDLSTFIERICFVLGLIAAVGLPLFYYDTALKPDESLFLLVGRELADGMSLYSEIGDHKPPAIFYLASWLELTKYPVRLGRFTVFGVNLLTGIVLYRLGREIKSKFVGSLAFFLFILSVYSPHFWGFTLHTEQFVVLLTGVIVLLLGVESPLKQFFVGICLGLSLLVHQVGGLNFVLVYLYLFFDRNSDRPLGNQFLKILRNSRHLLLGTGLVLLSVSGLFYSTGQLGDFLFLVVYNVLNYSPPFFLEGHVWSVLVILPLWVLGIFWALYRLFRTVRNPDVMLTKNPGKEWLVILWLILFFVPATWSWSGRHHVILILPPLALLSSLAISKLVADVEPGWKQPWVASLVGLVILMTGISVLANYRLYANNVAKTISLESEETGLEMRQWIGDRRVFPLTYENELPYRLELKVAGTYLGVIYSPALRRRVVNDLKNNRNVLVLVDKSTLSESHDRVKGSFSRHYNGIYRFVLKNYNLSYENEDYLIYARLLSH